jgi:hypothetical protein
MHLLLQDAWSAYVETPAPPKFRLQLMVFCVFFFVFLILKDMLPRWLLKLASTPHHHLTAEREGKTWKVGEGQSKRSKTKIPSHRVP